MANDLQTNLDIIDDFTQRLQVAVIGAEETTAKHEHWVEGTSSEVIQTINGPIKTLRGLIADWDALFQASFDSTVESYDSQFAEKLVEYDNDFLNYLLNIGFEPAEIYQGGITIERRPQTVAYDGVTYYWAGALPFTTTGVFANEADWLIAPIVGGIETPQITFATGGNLVRKTQSVLGTDGEWYFWTGSFPKTIPVASTLESAGGVGLNKFKLASGHVPVRPMMKILSTAAGFVLNAGSFEYGATITSSSQVLPELNTGRIWKWDGPIPKVVDLNSSPASSGGVGENLWNEVVTATGSSGSGITIGATKPTGVGSGHRWFCTTDGRTYVYFADGDSVQWVEESPQNSVFDGLEPRVQESLRRSYAEAGYNVVGTFHGGFTLVNVNDVGIDEATGKGYTGPAGPVAAGTDPASGGFVDVSRYVDSDFIPVNLLHNTVGITKVYSEGKWFAWDNPAGTLISFTNNNDYGTATMLCDVSGEIKEFEFVTAEVAGLRLAADGTYLAGFGIDGNDPVSDSTQKFHRACAFAESSGRTLRSNSGTVFKISALPPAITTNGFSVDLSGAEIIVDMLTSVRGMAVFSFSGTVDNSIKATLTGDSYDASFPVNDASVFKVGDYVVGKYTVSQDVTLIPTSNVDYEFLTQIVKIEGNIIKVATSRYYKYYSAPVGGGSFEIIKALPITDFSVRNVRKQDTTRGGVNTDHAVASTYLCAGYVFENLYNRVSNGTSVYHRISHNYRTTRSQNRFPTRTDAGRGYTEQHIACTNARVENPIGIVARHVVDFSNACADMDVIGGYADHCASYGFGTHGGWESNLRFNGQKGRSCGMFIFAGSGAVFGQHSANISVINPDGVGCEYLVLALTNGAKVTGLEIKNPSYKYHTSTYSYAVEASMDEVSIGGSGVIDGGIKLIPTQRDSFGAQKDLAISDVEIVSRSDNDVFLDISNVLNYEVRLSNCDLYGKIKQSSSNLSISFNDCGLNPPTTGLFDTSGRVTNRVSIKGGKVNLKGNTTDNTLNIKEFTYSGVDLESNNFTWNIMMTNPAGGGVFSLRDIQNPPAFDITGVSARISLTSFENGKNFVPSIPMLKLKGSNNRLTISSGIIVDSESTQIVIDPTCVNTNLILTSVTHSQPFTLAGTYRGGVVSGNVLLSGTQNIPTPLVLGTNVGYAQA